MIVNNCDLVFIVKLLLESYDKVNTGEKNGRGLEIGFDISTGVRKFVTSDNNSINII